MAIVLEVVAIGGNDLVLAINHHKGIGHHIDDLFAGW
jgi:hypothetical protein